MTLRELSLRKPFRAFVLLAGLILASATFYFDLTVVPGEITLLLPYILVMYFITIVVGIKAGALFSIAAVVLWFISSSRAFKDLSRVVFLNLSIKTIFVCLIFSLVAYNRKLISRIEEPSLADELTRLNNRRGFDNLALYEMKRLERETESCASSERHCAARRGALT
jgi:hypothetical protein